MAEPDGPESRRRPPVLPGDDEELESSRESSSELYDEADRRRASAQAGAALRGPSGEHARPGQEADRAREPDSEETVPAPSVARTDRQALWEHPEDEVGGESQPPSLGPLSILGFGPQPSPSAAPALPRGFAQLLGAAAAVIIIAGLREAREVLVPLVVSTFVATLTAPVVLFLRAKKIPAAVAVPSVIVLTLGVVGALTGLLAGSLNAFIQAAPRYQADLIMMLIEMSAFLERFGLEIDPSKLLGVVQPMSAIQFAAQLVSQVADLFSSMLLILLLTIFVLFEALVLPEKIRQALGDPFADLNQGLRVVRRVQAYVVVKTYTSLGTGAIIGLALHFMGVEFAMLWGLLAFLLNFVPNLGSIIAAIPAILMAGLQIGFSGAMVTAGIFLLVNMVIGNWIEPRVMGRRMNLSPLIVFMSLIFWGWMWGALGMLLSVPLTMVLRILLEGSPATRPLAILMAGTGDGSGQAALSSRPTLPPRPR